MVKFLVVVMLIACDKGVILRMLNEKMYNPRMSKCLIHPRMSKCIN